MAEDVLGAAEDGSMEVFIVARIIFQRLPGVPLKAPLCSLEAATPQGRPAVRQSSPS